MKVRALCMALVVIAFLLAGAAHASSWVMDSVLSGGLGDLDLHTVVNYDSGSGIYTYTYALTATDVVSAVHHFDVGNPYQLEFSNAQNVGADQPFDNPTYLSWNDSVLWSYGQILPGDSATFSYESYYAPMVGDVTATNLGHRAMGETYVMMVPEPIGVSGAAFLMLGLAGLYRFKRS